VFKSLQRRVLRQENIASNEMNKHNQGK